MHGWSASGPGPRRWSRFSREARPWVPRILQVASLAFIARATPRGCARCQFMPPLSSVWRRTPRCRSRAQVPRLAGALQPSIDSLEPVDGQGRRQKALVAALQRNQAVCLRRSAAETRCTGPYRQRARSAEAARQHAWRAQRVRRPSRRSRGHRRDKSALGEPAAASDAPMVGDEFAVQHHVAVDEQQQLAGRRGDREVAQPRSAGSPSVSCRREAQRAAAPWRRSARRLRVTKGRSRRRPGISLRESKAPARCAAPPQCIGRRVIAEADRRHTVPRRGSFRRRTA